MRCLPLALALCFVPCVADAATVRSRSGVTVRVHPSAQSPFQCVIDYLESHGVKIKFMRGYGRASVQGSMHPAGKGLDINQTGRNITRPHVPASLSNAAADKCGVVSGARWRWKDNGHWNLRRRGKNGRPSPLTANDTGQQAAG
jgi:hypothetical protein